jgi:hypothetical protein
MGASISAACRFHTGRYLPVSSPCYLFAHGLVASLPLRAESGRESWTPAANGVRPGPRMSPSQRRMRGLRRPPSLKDTVRSWFLGYPQNPDRVSSVRVGRKGRMLQTTNRAGRTKECSAGLFRSKPTTQVWQVSQSCSMLICEVDLNFQPIANRPPQFGINGCCLRPK